MHRIADGRKLTLLTGGVLFAGGGVLAVRELRRELPTPCQVLVRHLETPDVQAQLGFKVAPWSFRLWHGDVGELLCNIAVVSQDMCQTEANMIPNSRFLCRL